ncbi:MAG: hypothetical protein H2069_05365 [Legionella sp.]|nr:hypothetical protein [Legionella sp.]
MSKEFFENDDVNRGDKSPAVDDGSPLCLENSPSVEGDNQERTIPSHLVALEKAMMSLFFKNTEKHHYPTANNLLDFIHHDASSKALLMNFTRSAVAEYTKYLVKKMASYPMITEKPKVKSKRLGHVEKEMRELFKATTGLESTDKNVYNFITTDPRAISLYKNIERATVTAFKKRCEQNNPDLSMNTPTFVAFSKKGRVGPVEKQIQQLFQATTHSKPTAENVFNFMNTDECHESVLKNIEASTVSVVKKRLRDALNLPKDKAYFTFYLDTCEPNNPDLSLSAPKLVTYSRTGQRIGPKEKGMVQLFCSTTHQEPSVENIWAFFQKDDSKILYQNFPKNTVNWFKGIIAAEVGLPKVKKSSTLTSIVEKYRQEQPTLSLSALRVYCRSKIPEIITELNRTKASVTTQLAALFKPNGKIGRQFPSEPNLEGSASKKIKTIKNSLPPQQKANNAESKLHENILRYQATSIENPQMGNFDNQQILSGPLFLSDAYKNFAVFSQINPSESETTSIGDKQSSLRTSFK